VVVRLGRRTEWVQAGTDGWTGVGQRMLATDAGEFPLLDIRQVEFDEH
jgi:type VI secretion system protein ImpE